MNICIVIQMGICCKMYKNVIKRHIGYLVERKINEEKRGRKKFSFFSDIKRKEIILWMWMQENKDKDQIKECIIDKFNASDQDAENLFLEAYPDGLSLQENDTLDDLSSILSSLVGAQPHLISDAFNVVKKEAPDILLEQYQLPQNVNNQIKLVIGALLEKRCLI